MNKDSNYTRVCVWGQCGKHCSKDGKTDCTQAQTYGQLQELVEEGFECPLGHFGKELVELHPLHANWRYDQNGKVYTVGNDTKRGINNQEEKITDPIEDSTEKETIESIETFLL